MKLVFVVGSSVMYVNGTDRLGVGRVVIVVPFSRVIGIGMNSR